MYNQPHGSKIKYCPMKSPVPTSHGSASSHWHAIAYWGLLAAACAVMLVMSILTTLKEDDLAYSLVEGPWTPVNTFGDVLRSFGYHYFNSNGRIADLLAMLFSGLLGKTVFNICNAIVFGLMLHLLSLLSTGRRSLLAVSMFLAVVGTCYPVPGETMLWMAGSCNYMWSITASLGLMAFVNRLKGRLGWGKGLLLLLGAFVAGALNEATSFGFLAGWCLYCVFNRGRISRAELLSVLGYMAGVAFIVASPGAWERAAGGDIVINLPFADLMSSRWHIFVEKMWRFYLPVAALIIGLAVLLTGRAKAVVKNVWTWIFLCMALVMFALGINHERAYAPLATVAFIIIATVADALLRWRWTRVAVTIVSLALAVFTFARGIKALNDYRMIDRQVTDELVGSPSQAVLQERQFESYNRFIKPINCISTNFFAHEVIYRAYYDKSNVQFVADSVYVRFHEDRLLDGAQTGVAHSDAPDVLGIVYSFPDQDYIAIQIMADTLPCTFQTARYYRRDATVASLDAAEALRRKQYGIATDYDPHGFYPLEYQGHCYLIADRPDTDVAMMTFPMSLPPAEHEVNIVVP